MSAQEFLNSKGAVFVSLGKSKADRLPVVDLMEEFAKENNFDLLVSFHDWMVENDDYDINWPGELKARAFLAFLDGVKPKDKV